MCGFAGIFSPKFDFQDSFKNTLKTVGRAISHRGPDDSGVWLDKSVGLGFVHRRLSIQDLSLHGAQPMTSSSGRYILVFNGEIYNFKMLRGELERAGSVFRGHSDTETILAAFDAYGIDVSLERITGMFSIAVYDRENHQLTLVRDRMGEKPLYYGWNQGCFIFASELKALRAFPSWHGEINRNSLPLLLRHNFIPAPYSIYEGIFKLLPGSCIRLDLASLGQGMTPSPEHYWSLDNCFDSEKASPRNGRHAVEQLDTLLREVIGEQMISDVPLGAFLSGGVDSSTVVAIMQQLAASKVRTFTIGFDEQGFNEAEYAKAVANHLGTDHTELYVTAKDALDVIPKLPIIYDEPFADSSQIPTYLVAEMTQKNVTVALSGDGGDELFCGYDRYNDIARAWSKHLSSHTSVSNKLFNWMAERSPVGMARLIKLIVSSQRHLSADEVLEKVLRRRQLLNISEAHEFYRQSISFWHNPELLALGAKEPQYSMGLCAPPRVGEEFRKQMMWQDLNCYLPDDILTKVDRAAMACSLETRIPLLDRRVVEFALQLPLSLNVKHDQGKQVLREVLYRYVPRKLIEREKRGFAVPVGQWLRGELRDWAEALLDPVKLENDGYWNAGLIQRKWFDHCKGQGDHSFSLWGVLMFQSWLDSQR